MKNIKKNSKQSKEYKRVVVTKKLRELLDGLMLGDGSMSVRSSKSKSSANLEIEQRIDREGWIDDIKTRFDNFGISNKKTFNTKRQSVRLRTFFYNEFLVERRRWNYIPGIGKTNIPSDVSIAPLSLALWYMGDGSLNTSSIYLLTLCFTKESQIELIERINKRYGWKMEAVKRRVRNRERYTIYLPKADIRDFLAVIQPYMVNCFNYKLKALYDDRWLAPKIFHIWTDEELDILRDKYPYQGLNIPELLETRSKKAISAKIFTLKIQSASIIGRKYKWTDEEVDILRDEYPRSGANISRLLERHNPYGIRHKASRLGIISMKIWTDEEIDILKDMYPRHKTKIPQLLERHSKKSIYDKAYKSNLTGKFLFNLS